MQVCLFVFFVLKYHNIYTWNDNKTKWFVLNRLDSHEHNTRLNIVWMQYFKVEIHIKELSVETTRDFRGEDEKKGHRYILSIIHWTQVVIVAVIKPRKVIKRRAAQQRCCIL